MENEEMVDVPRWLLTRLYNGWSNSHGCYTEHCDCLDIIFAVQNTLRKDKNED